MGKRIGNYQEIIERIEARQSGLQSIDPVILTLSNETQPQENDSMNETMHRFYRPFRFSITPKEPCPSGIDTLFIVHTSIANHKRRAAIRETYANDYWEKKYEYRTIFVVGRSKDEEKERWIKGEARQYRDILQIDYIDAYRNMTIKFLNWMRFVRDDCPRVKMIVKMDDDILPNIHWIFDDFHNGTMISEENTFTCLEYHSPVVREKGSPWYVSKEAHPSDDWEAFCCGPAFIMSADLISRLVKNIENKQFYTSVDDAFVTGQIAKEIAAKHDFRLYEHNFLWPGWPGWEKIVERKMLAWKVIFGAYTTTTAMKRIFDELSHLSGAVTDPPDDLPWSNKLERKAESNKTRMGFWSDAAEVLEWVEIGVSGLAGFEKSSGRGKFETQMGFWSDAEEVLEWAGIVTSFFAGFENSSGSTKVESERCESNDLSKSSV
ncbi:unnamed protein product, partial [Mesorhabditis belari]|uniref:Hexosyltransferase n=1 Tax=Mesorhabditis belari TaxID=2138241 RepID=A0AAF3FI22_9BILA